MREEMQAAMNTVFLPKRVAQGAMIALFSAMHFALCTVVGAAIAAQHEAPNPATEDALYTLLHRLRQPLANPLIENFSFDGLTYSQRTGSTACFGASERLLLAMLFLQA